MDATAEVVLLIRAQASGKMRRQGGLPGEFVLRALGVSLRDGEVVLDLLRRRDRLPDGTWTTGRTG